ncbi:restriction endonuclease [Tunturibacter empetritectus]|uniref:Restriction endonuclease type IV Mrr domain-containing protein n=1 Tax=Tunturiibacter empetritectus TaxID=3069691 RepID=A0A7W8IG84_9BACT|nr:restriction endonuclease [Edaphobacter lichenicola]MBB5316644.1 hypothetical protein [Edaphobacter lichenicola]
MKFHLWERFSDYDNSVDEATFAKLIEDNFASLSMKGPTTNLELVERIAKVSNLGIPIESLSEILAEPEIARGYVVFGCPGDAFDVIARSYANMQWWLTDKGLNMAVVQPLHERLATRLMELESLSPQPRGFAFEGFLDSLFAVYRLSPRKSFRLIGEQIDGSFDLQGNTYLVEAKWQAAPIGNSELQSFAGKVRTKATWTRGLYVSNSGFSEEGLTAFRSGDSTRLICLSGDDLRDILVHKLNLVEVINLKTRRAGETGLAYIPVRELLDNRWTSSL